MEPWRFLCDLTTLEAFESGVLDLKDFYFLGDDYRYHIAVEAKRRFLELLKDRFNGGVNYKSKTWKWDTIILDKTQELGRYLLEKSEGIEFVEPNPELIRVDSVGIRKHILDLTQGEANKLGIGKSTLHYLRKNARSMKPLKINKSVRDKLKGD